jgi:vitamin B12 transporter
LVTPTPGAALRPKVRFEGGQDGYYNLKLSTGADLGPVGVFVNAGTRDSGEWVAGSERQVDFINAMAAWSIGESDDFTAQLHWLDGDRTSYPEQSGGPRLSVSSALERSNYTSELAALGWVRDWSETFRTDIKLNTLRYQEQTDSPGIVPYTSVPANGTDAVFKQQSVSWVNTAELGNDHSLSFGADYRDESGDSKGYLDFGFLIPTDYRLSRETTGVFLQWRARLADDVDLNLSTRYDDTDQGQHQHTSRLGLKYELTPAFALRANWGQGFKLPSFFALGHALVGNPDLLPEEAKGFDLGAEWQLSGSSVLGVSWFENRYTNLIDFDPQAFTNVNRDRVDTQGFELWGQFQDGETFSLDFSLTKTDIEVAGSARELEGRPDWQATLGALWALNSDLTARLDYRWVGEVFSSSLHTGQSFTQALDDQRQLDWRLMWAATANLSVNLAIDNVLDDNFETSVGFPNAGRTLRLGIQWQAD